MRSVRPSPHASGFTLVEALITMAVLSVTALLGYPAIQNTIQRYKLEGTARTAAAQLRLARLEAIKKSRPVAVRIDLAGRRIEAILDDNGDGVFDPAEPRLGTTILPNGVNFAAPTLDPPPIAGFPITGGVGQVVFLNDGSVDVAGGIRFADARRNYLEVQVAPRTTARIRLRKWDGIVWHAKGEGGLPWHWF